MADYGRTRETSAAPEKVWAIWSDPGSWHEWNPGVSSMELDGPFATGTTGRMHTPAGRTHAITFDNVVPGRSFELRTKVIPGTEFFFKCEVQPSGAGSRIGQSVRVGGPLSFLGGMFGPQVAASFDGVLDGLKQKVEAA